MARPVKSEKRNNFEECPPRADALINSIRAFGYDLAMAIADLIDNSLFAGATDIHVEYSWNNGDPWIRIVDNGAGMSDRRLYEAMRLGSQSPLEERDPEDLGRFGLGLKTASFSQCRMLAVQTKMNDGQEASRFWDLDHVQETGRWELGKVPPPEIQSLYEPLKKLSFGTVVVWQKLDRMIDHTDTDAHDPETSFNEKFLTVKKYLETVFHRFLQRRRKKICIRVGVGKCEPWDPFLIKNTFTQELGPESYEDDRMSCVPYVLPHVSKRTQEENLTGSGLRGWNAQQGFYVYRNERMIVNGGYLALDLKPEEHYKLARIKVDITNDMDHEWSIDVRKAVASPPDHLRAELLRIARVARQRASEVYRARSGRPREERSARQNLEDVWIKKKRGEKIIYKVNPENSALKLVVEEENPPKRWISKLFHIIETTVPHQLIIMDGAEHEDCHSLSTENLTPPPEGLIEVAKDLYCIQVKEGKNHIEAVDFVCRIEPFDIHPEYRAVLDDMEPGGSG